ncbi:MULTISPECIES: sporulation protein YqfD [Bacillaceae]|uniref:sporulation protein YqfD n=1 Tax=Bacillaceae TaxID=186817 RepID=UPI0005A88AD2|nr:sporulation protein YqfD [Bacillus rubiinfantis]
MKNQWFEVLFGKVTVKVTGRGIERFLNILTRNGFLLWDVKRHGTETLTFKMKFQDAKDIRHHARNSGCSISFLERKGIPLLIKRLFKNSGFLIGAALFLLIIMLLSNVIWEIEIKGAKPSTEYQIRKELEKMGLEPGEFQFLVGDVETIQRKLINNIGTLTWVGVELRGTTYHFQVVEKNETKKRKKLSPRHLVAKKEATIINYYIENGQKVIDKNEHVEPGQLLVSGEIGENGQTKLVPAKGEVWGETWYKSHVNLPLKTNLKVFSGKVKQKNSILVGKVEIPIVGFGNPKFKNFETDKSVRKIHFLKWDLPIYYVSKTIRESEEITRTYTYKQAEKVAVEMAKEELKSNLNKDASIKDTYILSKKIENGKLVMDIHIKAIENIAKSQPIKKEFHE